MNATLATLTTYMHVPRSHHRRVVSFLGIVILILIGLIGYELWENKQLQDQQDRFLSPDPNTPPGELLAPDSPFLQDEEVVVVEPESVDGGALTLPLEKVLFQYVEVVDGCEKHFEGECLNARSGPGTEYDVVAQLRNNIVLKVDGLVDRDGELWYKIIFDEYLHYPERVTTDWYVSAKHVEILYDEGDKNIWEHDVPSTTKRIEVDIAKQYLMAYDGDTLFMETPVSTGLALTPTPKGTFTVFKKTPSRYMQGPLPGLPADQYYDLPGVPWNLYFTHGGAVIHGAYWHDSFGSRYSHGCINLPPELARELYNWAPIGTPVIVK